MELDPKQERQADHVYHVWINKRQQERRDQSQPWENSLYEFKSILQFLQYGHIRLREAFEGKLTSTHQQCSHQLPVPILNNKVLCCLGTNVVDCPILSSLKVTFSEEIARVWNGKKTYDLPDEALYRLMAKTCAWHIYGEAAGVQEGFHGVDTSEGHLLDESDRMFWRNVYDSMNYDPSEEEIESDDAS